jgi:hypothetical protein
MNPAIARRWPFDERAKLRQTERRGLADLPSGSRARRGGEVTRRFDMLHVCPPQTAPDFVRSSPLAGDAGWIDVDGTVNLAYAD